MKEFDEESGFNGGGGGGDDDEDELIVTGNDLMNAVCPITGKNVSRSLLFTTCSRPATWALGRACCGGACMRWDWQHPCLFG